MSDARTRIEAHLAQSREPVSAAVIAAMLRLGRSTVTRHLATLESEGRAARIEQARQEGRRLPDLWQTPATAPQNAAPEDATSEPDTPTVQAAEPEPADEATAPVPPAPTATGSAAPVDLEGADTRPEEETPSRAAGPPAPRPAPAAPAPAPAMNRITRTQRLEPGQLRLMVKAILDNAPEDEFSPTELGHLLSRSVGAIQNCLARLVKAGEARLTQEAPRRYGAA